ANNTVRLAVAKFAQNSLLKRLIQNKAWSSSRYTFMEGFDQTTDISVESPHTYLIDIAMAHNDPSKQVEEFTSQLGDDPNDQTVQDGTPEVGGYTLYPMLGSPNPLWMESLEELLEEGAHAHYLLNGADSDVMRHYCRRIPDMLNACIQTISHMTGATISAQAVWPGFDDSAVLCTYSTITQHALDYIPPVDAIEEIAYLIHQVCYGAGPLLERKSINAYPVIYMTVEAKGRPLLCPPHPCLQQCIMTLIEFFSMLGLWQGIPSFTWAQVIESHHKGLKIYFSPLRAPDNFLYDKPPEQWKTDKVDMRYGHVLGYQTRYYSGDPDAEGCMFQWVENDVNEPLCTEPAGAIESLYNEEHATYYLAMWQHVFHKDTYMPLLPLPGHWFKLSFLQKNSQINEKLDQPEQSDPALFQEVQHRLEDPDLFLELFKIPKVLYDYDDEDHDVYAVHSLSQFIIKTNHIISAEWVVSSRMGIYSICLCVLAIAKLIHEMEEGVVVPVFQGALSSPWRPKRILYQREGTPEDLKIEWPYGDWGTDHATARLAGLLKSPTVLALTDSKHPSLACARHQLDAMPTVDVMGVPPAPPDNTASSLPLIQQDESELLPILPKSGHLTSSTLESCEIAGPSISLSRNPEDPMQIQSPHTEGKPMTPQVIYA
ncbi:hypothetical protein FRC11_003488, partial [Ceratobasidium sp. 423]